MEVVVDGDLCASLFVDPVHVAVECGSVTVVVVVSVRDEEVGVDHLVQQRLHKVGPRTQLQQGNRKPEKKKKNNTVQKIKCFEIITP